MKMKEFLLKADFVLLHSVIGLICLLISSTQTFSNS